MPSGATRRRSTLFQNVPAPNARFILMAVFALFLSLCLLVTVAGIDQSRPQGDVKSNANETRVCRSQGGRFPPYAIQGKEPRRVRGAESLSLCKAYKWKTCCGKEQTDTALLWLRKLATSGEAGADCLALWEVVECAVCDPDVGVSEGPPIICRSLCDRLLDACGGAYFALDTMTQDLLPCGRRDLVCTTAAEWASSGAHFCQLAGYRTADDVTDDVTPGRDPPCFDGTRIPSPGGREEERRGKKKRESGFWDAAKKVRKKAGGELEGGVGFTVVLTSAIILMWVARKYGQYLGFNDIVAYISTRQQHGGQKTVQGMLQEARRKQQARYSQDVKATPGNKKKA